MPIGLETRPENIQDYKHHLKSERFMHKNKAKKIKQKLNPIKK